MKTQLEKTVTNPAILLAAVLSVTPLLPSLNAATHYVWKDSPWLTLAGILLNLAVGVGMIMANRRHLKGLDEMQQKIQLEAMALSLGVGLIGGLAYSNLDVTNLIAFDAEISHLVILMALTYMVGIAVGVRRYR